MASVDSVARLLAISAGNAGGGGGTGGTSNYPDLANKPKINGVELVGNKTSEDLGIDPGISEETLIQTIAQESAARQKQDDLLQGEIEEKMAPANILAGEGISVSQSGLNVTISAEANYQTATESDIESIFSSSLRGAFTLTYKIGDEIQTKSVNILNQDIPRDVLRSALVAQDNTSSSNYELTVSSENDLLDSLDGLFVNLGHLTKLDITGLKMGALEDKTLQEIFESDTALVEVNMSGLTFPSVVSLFHMIRDLDNLETVNMSNCSFPNLETITYMFAELPSLVNLQLGLGSLPKLGEASDVIRDCNGLVNLDLSGLDVSKATNLNRMVIFVDSLESITLPNDISSATILDSVVRSAPKLETIDFSGRTNNVVTSFQWGFANDTGLKNIDLTMIDFSKVTGMKLQHMFQNCSSLEEVKVNSSWNESPASKSNIFDGASISNVTVVEV